MRRARQGARQRARQRGVGAARASSEGRRLRVAALLRGLTAPARHRAGGRGWEGGPRGRSCRSQPRSQELAAAAHHEKDVGRELAPLDRLVGHEPQPVDGRSLRHVHADGRVRGVTDGLRELSDHGWRRRRDSERGGSSKQRDSGALYFIIIGGTCTASCTPLPRRYVSCVHASPNLACGTENWWWRSSSLLLPPLPWRSWRRKPSFRPGLRREARRATGG